MMQEKTKNVCDVTLTQDSNRRSLATVRNMKINFTAVDQIRDVKVCNDQKD